VIREEALGPEHLDVVQSLKNLALLAEAQGRYAEAQTLYERVLAISETALGADHPSVATTRNNIAAVRTKRVPEP
jgi:tetratricopeptide (TPR) repeat protein